MSVDKQTIITKKYFVKKMRKTCVCIFTVLSWSTSNSSFVAFFFIFSSKSVLFINREISDSLTNVFFYIHIKYIIRKFIIIRNSKIDVWYFCIIICFLTRSLTLVIFSSATVRVEVVTNCNTRYFTFYTPDLIMIICFLEVVLVSMALNFLTNSSYTSFLTTFLSATSLHFLKSTGAGFNLSTSHLPILLSKLFKPLGTYFYLSTSNLSTSDFKITKSVFLINFNVSTPVAFSSHILLHN